MAVSAAAVWEVRASGASDNSGGAFVAGATGTDRSQQNAAQVAIDNATITTSVTTNVITFTGGYSPSAADVGNVVQVISGTNTTANSFFNITSMVAGTSWTVNGNVVSAGTTTNMVANMGGALATLAKLAGAMVASNKAYATGAFTSTATTTFAQSVTPTGAAPATRLIGYGSTRGDTTHATLTLSTNTGLTGINCTGTGFSVEQMDVDCSSLGTSTGISVALNSAVSRCKVSNFTTVGISGAGSNLTTSNCEVTGGGSAATAGINQSNAGIAIVRCFVHDNACPGIRANTTTHVISCLSVNNSGAASDGIITVGSGNWILLNNTCHNNGRDGIRISSTVSAGLVIRNNLLTNNGGVGLLLTTGTALPAAQEYDGNAYGGGTSANTGGTISPAYSVAGIYSVSPYTPTRDVTLSVSPYVGPTTGTTGNFALNNETGGGAACRGAGSPATWQGNTGTTGYPDMGAVQHQGFVGSGRLTGGLQ